MLMTKREKGSRRAFAPVKAPTSGIRDDLDGGRRTHVAEQGEDLLVHDELLGVGHATRRIVAVVLGQQGDLATVDPAAFVDGGEVAHGPQEGLAAQEAGVPGQGERAPDADLGRAHARGFPAGGGLVLVLAAAGAQGGKQQDA